MNNDMDLSPKDLRRFEDKYIPEPNCGCWLWHGSQCRGYGQFWIEGRLQKAHRVSYRYYVGEIPPNMDLDHLCRVRCCVNPKHLEPVTRSENTRRGLASHVAKSRAQARDVCERGHPLSNDNLVRLDSKQCRECLRASMKRQRERKASAEGRVLGQGNGNKTHCPHGHPYSGTNLYVTSHGYRQCRACTNIRSKKRRHPQQEYHR